LRLIREKGKMVLMEKKSTKQGAVIEKMKKGAFPKKKNPNYANRESAFFHLLNHRALFRAFFLH
jgi:hypothetical protein